MHRSNAMTAISIKPKAKNGSRLHAAAMLFTLKKYVFSYMEADESFEEILPQATSLFSH
jgi:hypothetical protein